MALKNILGLRQRQIENNHETAGQAPDNEGPGEAKDQLLGRFPEDHLQPLTQESYGMIETEDHRMIRGVVPNDDGDDGRDSEPPMGGHPEEAQTMETVAMPDSPPQSKGNVDSVIGYLTGKRTKDDEPVSKNKYDKDIASLRKKYDSKKQELKTVQSEWQRATEQLKGARAASQQHERDLMSARSDISRLHKELRNKENELRETKEGQNRQIHKLNEDKRKLEDEKVQIEHQKHHLSQKIYELTGGIEYASHDQFRRMIQSWQGAVADLATKYFPDLDLENPSHMQFIQNKPDGHDFHLLKEHQYEVYSYLCESWLSNSVLRRTEQYFCIGTDQAFSKAQEKDRQAAESVNGSVTAKIAIDRALQLMESLATKAAADTEAKELVRTWRSYTMRLILSVLRVDLRELADHSSGKDVFRKSPTLAEAISEIVSQVMKDMEEFTLPRIEPDGTPCPKSDKLIAKHRLVLEKDIVSVAAQLMLNIRLSPHQYDFISASCGKEVNPKWMEYVGTAAGEAMHLGKEGNPRKAAVNVLFETFPCFAKQAQEDPKLYDFVAKAKVYPVILK